MGRSSTKLSDARIIDMFLARSERVLTNAIVDRANLGNDFTIAVQVRSTGTRLGFDPIDKGEVHDLAVRIRPFLPWVKDATSFYKTRQAVRRSLTDPKWQEASDEFSRRCKDAFEADQVIHAAMDKDGEIRWKDHEMAKAVIDGLMFHEEENPRIAKILGLEISQPFQNQSVLRMLNVTVCAVKGLQRFIVDAADEGVLHPKV
ncbi:hypothetical protein HQO44_06580 [Rhodococcus fascians]|nr:hypothetical protein [Rhodococcus fascians]